MTEKSAVERGWEFSSRIMGTNVAAGIGSQYVKAVNDAINELTKNINKAAADHGALGIDQLQGFIYEEFSAGTFNIDAVAAGSHDRATVLHETGLNSVDIKLKSGKTYSAKSYKTPEAAANAQAKFDANSGKAAYDGQYRLTAGTNEELEQAQAHLDRQAKRNAETRPDVAKAYSETSSKMRNRIENDEGVSSRVSTRKENAQMTKEAKEGKYKAEEHGIDAASSIKTDYIVKQALKAGYTAAIITAVTQIAPEIYKALDYLIKNGELRLEDILRIGEKGISGTAEGFLRGSVSSSLDIVCQSGMLGEAFKLVSPEILATMVTLTMQTIKNSILVAAGKMTPQQMGAAFANTLVISSGYLLGAKIGGIIGQAIGFSTPVIGYLIGSLVGTAFSVVYNIGKKKFISFCVDTGFTCFGLVEQDYQLPEEFLNKMGINTIKLNRTTIHQTNISTARISQTTVNRQDYETIGFTMPRRGLIGVNKVGYVV